ALPSVVAENLVKSYGKVRAVDGLSLMLNEGSVTGLIGPNGAGKTTTIKIILGLLKPDDGRVEVFGQDPWDNPKIRTLIGVVYEKAFFPSHQKVIDYLRRTCRIFGVPESRALEVLRLVDLQEVQDRAIKALSAGMLQKFAIAHALINYPQLVIADEMTSNLDPQSRSALLDLVLNLNKDEKVTFLLSSHILPELSRVCDSVAIINRGRVWAFGKLTELYEKYSVGIIRISTDKPTELSEEIRKLSYVEKLEIDAQGISIRVTRGREEEFYEDISKLARKVKAKMYEIETGSASLEELYRLVVSANKLEALNYEKG
ncbi:ABC transporter ATP-binding protein, partial [Candidatus Bathyarchaeota archaeon]|nr:ABC transporter ATP-binding protein [Candidatus Bathyarchaeota archaeon]